MGKLRQPLLKRCTGFTLVELLIVMSIAVVLASVGLALYGTSVKRAKEAALLDDLRLMRKAIDEYYADKLKYPATLDTLVSDKYLRSIPPDPFTLTADTWQTTPSEPDPANPTAEPGISDVKSGAEGTSLDGKAYSDW